MSKTRVEELLVQDASKRGEGKGKVKFVVQGRSGRREIPERPRGGGHLAAMNCVGELQRVLHQCCGILVKPLSAFFGHLPFDFIFKLLLMEFFSHDLGQLSHPFPLS